MKSDYYNKYKNIIPSHFFEKKNINILEFGVENGNTTSLFIEICENNDGFTYSIDTVDYSKLFSNSKWKFIKRRDDDYDYIGKNINDKKFDIICLDTIHTKEHVKKILYHYYKLLNINGIFLIDGISHLPYLKLNYRDNFYSEINNNEIFDFLINLKNNHSNSIDLDFSFQGSGVARITKFKDVSLFEKKIISRKKSFKNILRKLIVK